MVEMSMDRWMRPGEFTLDWRASAGSGFMIDSVRLCGWGPADGMLEGIGGFDAEEPMGLGVEDRAGRVPETLARVPADATLGDVAGMVGRASSSSTCPGTATAGSGPSCPTSARGRATGRRSSH